ncbi:MAG: SDR family oxidoreductase [Chitinophagales bacterium]
MKKILILGGTMFVGRVVTERLKNNPQYQLTLFNRGKSNAELFADVRQLHGNRETEDIEQILKEDWDVIIDFSGYYPITFEKLLHALKGKVKRYIFVSTISVFDFEKLTGKNLITERDEILACSEAQRNSRLPDAYGEKKAEMERALLQQDWLDSIIFRPSFISGKYDWTERFYYWVYRVKKGNKILFPSVEAVNTSITLGDDLASAIIMAIDSEKKQSVYNSISFTQHSLHDFITTTSSLLNKPVEIVGITEEQQKENGLLHGLHQGDFPLFVGGGIAVDDTLFKKDFPVALKDYRKDIEEIIAAAEKAGWPEPKPGLKWDREQEILAAL